MDTPLPIDDALPALTDALRAANAAVLVAPPGAGKTTRVPLALVRERWAAGKKIIVLEPRRLAARAAAVNGLATQPVPANANILAALSERRSGQERRDAEAAIPLAIDERRTGLERRSAIAKPVSAAGFGRRTHRTT